MAVTKPKLILLATRQANKLGDEFSKFFDLFWASLVAQMVKNLPAMQETWVQSLGWEDLLEEEITTHFSILA